MAQDHGALKGLYGSFNMGLGIVSQNVTHESRETTPQFAMHFNIGLFLLRSVQAGITLNGWLYEPYYPGDFYYKGESISNAMFHLQFYPVKNKRIYFKGAYGNSRYTNMRPSEYSGKGYAFMLASGYEKEIGKGELLMGLQLSWNYGDLKFNYLPSNSNRQTRNFQALDLTLYLAID